EPCPGDSTKRSRSNHPGLAGLYFRNRVQSTYAIDAAPIGIPGWPLSAFCTASTERKRRVLMHALSNAGSEGIAGGAAFIRILRLIFEPRPPVPRKTVVTRLGPRGQPSHWLPAL